MTWYRVNARDLPWRRRHDAYAVWLSETMLQQTQVDTVKAYFERFLASLPTLESLAQADEDVVLRLWEGLGYYRRARQLHQAAKIIAAEHQGEFPRDPQAVRDLPGIGRYTAGAILSIAFGARQPILEANTVRLFSRLLAYDGDPRSSEGQRILWAMAEQVLPQRHVGQFNQALMELGGEICTIREPRCESCPVAPVCRANQQRRQHEIPRPKAKRVAEAVREAAVVIRHRGRILLLRWPEGRRWAGLWDFPRFPVHAEHPADLHDALVQNVFELTGEKITPGKHFATFSHSVTRFRITLDCYAATRSSRRTATSSAAGIETAWWEPSSLQDCPLNSTGRKITDLILSTHPHSN